MGREIIVIQAGQCGNQIGARFWEDVGDEHGIDPLGIFQGESDLQLERINVYYQEATGGKYVPRAVLVDLEAQTLDTIRSGMLGYIYRPENILSGQSGTGNNYAKGFYTDGQEIVGKIMDVIRKEAESCDSLQGFQFLHSLGGGTGSGLGSLLLTKVNEHFSRKLKYSYAVFPSAKFSDKVVQAYNCMLSFKNLIEIADGVFCLDNEGLYDLCFRALGLTKPKYEDLNRLISMFMSGSTCSLRFPGQLNSDLRKLAVNLVPFPRMHFFVGGLAPLTPPKSQKYQSLSIQDLTNQLFVSNNLMAACDPQKGIYLSASAHFRGKVSPSEIDEQLALIQNQHNSSFVGWIPNNLKSSITNIPPIGMEVSATFVGNTTATQQIFTRIDSQFQKLYARRAFVHWYVNEGVEVVEFDEARSAMTDMIQETEMYQDLGVSDQEEPDFLSEQDDPQRAKAQNEEGMKVEE